MVRIIPRFIRLVAGPGFEPGSVGPEPTILGR